MSVHETKSKGVHEQFIECSKKLRDAVRNDNVELAESICDKLKCMEVSKESLAFLFEIAISDAHRVNNEQIATLLQERKEKF
jgi:hypothetical protein